MEREREREKAGSNRRGEETANCQTLSSHRDQKMEGQERRGMRARRRRSAEEEGEREEDRRAGHLREMDLGAPRGHILFPFEAPDKSNAAECIIR